jgi:AraC-like DNA-binding protein
MNALLPQFLDVLVPWAIRHQWPAGQRYESDPLELHSLWLVLEGNVQAKMGGREWNIEAGSAFLWPPNDRREIKTTDGAHWLSICLRATLFGQINLMQLLWPPIMWQPQEAEYSALRAAMEGIVNEWVNVEEYSAVTPATVDLYVTAHYRQWPTRDTVAAVLCDAYAKTIVGLCWRALGKIDLEQATGQNFPSWLANALQRLREEPDISIDKLASEAGVSPTQFRRQFQSWFGSSPREYFNRLRLEEARLMLESSQLTVQEIAEQIGFLSAPHFNRLFKQSFGLPPAQYRQLARVPSREAGEARSEHHKSPRRKTQE